MPSDADLKRGYTVNASGEIVLLRPLPPDTLSDLIDHHPNQITTLQVQQTKLEIETPIQPAPRSRQSKASNGYIFLVGWSNACLLRILMTAWFRRYREIHGYNRGFYPSNFLYNPPLQSRVPLRGLNSSRPPLNSFNYIPAPSTPASSLSSSKSPLNSFTPAWLNPKLLDRLEAQILDSLRSVIANTEEGFARPTTIEYLTFLGYSQASLVEAKGDGQRMGQDKLLASKPGSQLADLGIDLKDWHQALKKSVISRPAENKGFYRNLQESKGTENTGLSTNLLQVPLNSSNNKGLYRNLKEFPLNPLKSPLTSSRPPLNSSRPPLNSSNFGYDPVDNFNPAELSCEMFIELINKTDWHLRQLVVSLEEKLNQDKQYYLIEQARLKGKINWRK